MSKLKAIFALLLIICISVCLPGCTTQEAANIVATTLPVYELTAILCAGTDLTVSRLITEEISCLHDYTLQVSQMRMIEAADVVVLSGAGLESFLGDTLDSAKKQIDASAGISLLCSKQTHHHNHDHDHDHKHDGEYDPHIWLDPVLAKQMAANIYEKLVEIYPEHADHFLENHYNLQARFDKLSEYAESQLSVLTCRELITFHDGFTYLAQAYDLSILHAIEEESGSEASASELIELIGIVQKHKLPGIFVEHSGSVSAAKIISAETGAKIYSLDMAMSGTSYFDAMYHNIDTLKEALG